MTKIVDKANARRKDNTDQASVPVEVSGSVEAERPDTDDLDRLREEIEQHPVYHNTYFKRLQHSVFTPETYALHRANIFCRTEQTVKGIAHVCARAADRNDDLTLVLFSHILNEECGNGDARDCHAVLMENTHNQFGRVAFGLSPLSVVEAKDSPLIVAGTRQYRQRIRELTNASYPRLLGVAMALESHAEKMLTHCRTAFRAHAECFDRSEFVHSVEVYFNAHLSDGVEERHAIDAVRSVRRNCETPEDFAEVAYGAREALKVQLAMWQDLAQKRVEIEGGFNV